MDLISKLYNNKLIASIIHTLPHELQKYLKDCDSVLDLGCGPSSPLQYCKNIKYSVGVEVFKAYLKESKKKKIHTKYINKKIQDLDFKPNSFDAVILIDVLEHLPKKDGLNILKKAEKWARKKIIVTTPNGYFPMDVVDENPYQRHISGWNYDILKKMGFKCYGMSGAKFFYLSNNNVDSLGNKEAHLLNIRFKPKRLFYLLAGLSQAITYYFPKYAFELFCIKEVENVL